MNREEVIERVTKNGYQIKHLDPSYRSDREIILHAVQSKGRALHYASSNLQNDYDVVMAAVNQDGRALDFASEECRKNKEIVLAAVRNNTMALHFVSCEELRTTDKEVIQAVEYSQRESATWKVQQDALQLKYVNDKWRNDKNVVMEAVKSFGLTLDYASNELKNDLDVVMTAVTDYGWALQFASESLRDDYDVVMAAVSNNGNALSFAGEACVRDKDIVLTAVKNEPKALMYARNGLKQDRDCLIAAGLWNNEQNQQKRGGKDHNNDAAGVVAVHKNRMNALLSTKFTANQVSKDPRTEHFCNLIRNHSFFKDTVDKIYAPKRNTCSVAVDDNTTKNNNNNNFNNNRVQIASCDLQWTNPKHPCRGTYRTCQKWWWLKVGDPKLDKSCWRYEFNYICENHADIIIQPIEWYKDRQCHVVSDSQLIETDIANRNKVKIFRLYQQKWEGNGGHVDGDKCVGRSFEFEHVDKLVEEIKNWYDDDCMDLDEKEIWFDDATVEEVKQAQ